MKEKLHQHNRSRFSGQAMLLFHILGQCQLIEEFLLSNPPTHNNFWPRESFARVFPQLLPAARRNQSTYTLN